ncbi:MAG: hypothetical protein J0J06_15230 [Sphingomonas sp.]|uniref:hypothetical protein n=1 Tax=Sphingomonas sp. TaxID=28214 RepID=UPI001ACF1326|nr:hypothetical protein [Sphingomonas sp.]MBN8816785.1 hypothetical protein [Sphingomonas sp.]
MNKALIPLAFAATLGLAACGQKAQDETAGAANTLSADANATMAKAASDVDAAADKAFGAAENSMDKVGNVATDARKKAGAAAKDVGNEIED